MIDSIIFDLDGTLWDTTEELLKCWKSEVPTITKTELMSCMGLTPEGIADKLNIPIETVVAVQKKEIPWLAEHRVSPYIGVTLMLQYFYDKYPMFIVSNCQDGYIESFLQTNHLIEFFTDWRHSDGLSKAENVLNLILTYKIHPILVGDTEGDQMAALVNDIPFVWAKYGFGNLDIMDINRNIIYKPMDLTLLTF